MDQGEGAAALARGAHSVPEVEEAVRRAITASGGRITYARFIAICLYHEARGYYAGFGPADEPGVRAPAADYFTSVDLHPAFGELLARELVVHLGRLAKRGGGPLWIVELGAGRGLLCRDILQALSVTSPESFERVRYLIVEPNPGWLSIQRRNLLPDFEARVRWVRAFGPSVPVRAMRGVVVCNELFDALPFHVVEGSPGEGPGLREVFVAAPEGAGGPLAEVVGTPSSAAIAAQLHGEGVDLAPAQRAEVCLEAGALARDMASAIGEGAVVVVDYGDPAAALYNVRTRPQGTLRCFFRHRLNDHPLERLGRQDITAHVDFTALAGAFEAGGLKVHRLERQKEFLERHGLGALIAKLEHDQPGLARDVFVRHRRALEALRDPKGLGANLVLVAWR